MDKDFSQLNVTHENIEAFKKLFRSHNRTGIDESEAISIGFMALLEVKNKEIDMPDKIPFLVTFYKFRLLDYHRSTTRSRITGNFENGKKKPYQVTNEFNLNQVESKQDNFDFLLTIKNDLERDVAYLLSLGTPVVDICKQHRITQHKVKVIKERLGKYLEEESM